MEFPKLQGDPQDQLNKYLHQVSMALAGLEGKAASAAQNITDLQQKSFTTAPPLSEFGTQPQPQFDQSGLQSQIIPGGYPAQPQYIKMGSPQHSQYPQSAKFKQPLVNTSQPSEKSLSEQIQKIDEQSKNQADVIQKQLSSLSSTFRLLFAKGMNRVACEKQPFHLTSNQIIAKAGESSESYFVKARDSLVVQHASTGKQEEITKISNEGSVHCLKMFTHTVEGEDGKTTSEYLAIGGEKETKGFLKIWDVKAQEVVYSKVLEPNRQISRLEVTIRDGNSDCLVCGTLHGTIQIFKIPAWKMLQNLYLGQQPKAIFSLMALNLILSEKSYFFEYKSFEKTTRFITIGREDGLIIVMNTDSWKFHFSIRAHEGKVNDLKKIYFQKCAKQYNYFSSNDFEYLVSCGSDGTVKLWQIEETSKLHKTIDDSPVAVSCLTTVKGTTQKHDKLLLTGAVDGVIRVYLADLEFQLIQKIVSKNQRSVLSLAVVNDEIKTVLAVEAEAGEGSEENGESAVSSIILQQYVTGL